LVCVRASVRPLDAVGIPNLGIGAGVFAVGDRAWPVDQETTTKPRREARYDPHGKIVCMAAEPRVGC